MSCGLSTYEFIVQRRERDKLRKGKEQGAKAPDEDRTRALNELTSVHRAKGRRCPISCCKGSKDSDIESAKAQAPTVVFSLSSIKGTNDVAGASSGSSLKSLQTENCFEQNDDLDAMNKDSWQIESARPTDHSNRQVLEGRTRKAAFVKEKAHSVQCGSHNAAPLRRQQQSASLELGNSWRNKLISGPSRPLDIFLVNRNRMRSTDLFEAVNGHPDGDHPKGTPLDATLHENHATIANGQASAPVVFMPSRRAHDLLGRHSADSDGSLSRFSNCTSASFDTSTGSPLGRRARKRNELLRQRSQEQVWLKQRSIQSSWYGGEKVTRRKQVRLSSGQESCKRPLSPSQGSDGRHDKHESAAGQLQQASLGLQEGLVLRF